MSGKSTHRDLDYDQERKRLAPNAVFAVLQVVVSSVILFLLYRFLLTSLGVEALGVWSLVVAAASLANVSNLGLAGGTVRFVSKHLTQDDAHSAGLAVETATLSTAVVMGLIVMSLSWVIDWLLGLFIPIAWIDQARQVVPFSLAALWLSSVGSVIHSGLDGCHRADLRSLVTMLTQPLLLLMTIWLVPQMGLKGIAYAQMLQYLVWLGLGWYLLRKQLPALSFMPIRWSRRLFLEMWRDGVNFQLISILTLMTEPLAKGLLSHYGNLSAVGYFEMANRLVGQVRALLVSANQVLVPYYSKIGETSREGVKTLYVQNLNMITMLGSLAFSSLVAMLPLISELWIGRLEPRFLLFAVMLSGGWFVNTLAVPAYFANLGLGRLAPNVLSHVVFMMAMVPLTVMGGILMGAFGSAAAWPLSLVLGACVMIGSFHRAEGIPISVVFCTANIKAMALGGVFALFGFLTCFSVFGAIGFYGAIAVSLVLLILSWALYLIVIPAGWMFVRSLNGWAGLSSN